MDLHEAQQTANWTRYVPGQRQGHYESFFLRANHPSRPLAFWIRYTIFSPHEHPERAMGELWSVFFNGETGEHVAAKKEVPFAECSFARDRLEARVGDASLASGRLRGAITNAKTGGTIEWDLSYAGDHTPIFWFPLKFYTGGFPKAKGLVSLPLASFTGSIVINGATVAIDSWVGSENHNWGIKHTDYYAWGQVAGFDNAPGSFLELATAKIKIGPIWSPFFTPIVLRHDGREYALNELHTLLFRASFSYFHWNVAARSTEIDVRGVIRAEARDFVCLPYYNPPGGVKMCLNSKIASCELDVTFRRTGERVRLVTAHRAAFEILTDKTDHGLLPAV